MMRTHLLRAAGFLAALGTAATAIVVLFGHVTNGSHASAAPSTGATDGDPAAISAAEAAQMGFTPASVHQRGRFTGASGRAFGLYVGKRSDTGKECVILAGAGGTGAACDATLFTNGPVSFVEAFSGGPAKSNRTDFEIAGVVAADVARLDVVDSLHRVTRINTLGANKSFFFQLNPADLARGVDVDTLVARDAHGTAIASFDVSQQVP
jgi:hypothetical protein